MKALRFIGKWLRRLLSTQTRASVGLDSHRWESKMEILGTLSRGGY
ncbi:MAG: hypothetical protein P8Z79_10225 [Sedimentisphaerales bacterium]|jgi:hypothetical protein